MRLKLPPIRLYAEAVEPLHDLCRRILVQWTMLAANDLNEQFTPERAGGVVKPEQFTLLPRLHLMSVIRMIETQTFDDMIDRPFDQFCRERTPSLEVKWARTR